MPRAAWNSSAYLLGITNFHVTLSLTPLSPILKVYEDLKWRLFGVKNPPDINNRPFLLNNYPSSNPRALPPTQSKQNQTLKGPSHSGQSLEIEKDGALST